MTDSDIKTIISIIDVLISPQEHDAKAQVGCGSSFIFLLQQRLACFAEKASADANVAKILSSHVPHLLRQHRGDNPLWLFLDHCISLLIALIHLLDEASTVPTPSHPHDPAKPSDAPPAPTSCLGVLQQKSVQGLLQFVVALGINPNLLPGVGLALERRTASGVPECSAALLPWQKHRYLVASVQALLVCIESPVLCSMVLHHHLVDVLAASLQLCHAPIRKISDDSESCKPEVDLLSRPSAMEKLNLSLVKCRAGAPPPDDTHLIKEMLEDRQRLGIDLQHLLETTYQPLIVRELLLLISNPSDLTLKKASVVKRTPQWLRDICGQLLTESLLRKGGLAQVILGIFDAWSVDSSGGLVSEEDWQKCETFAKIVARIPSTKSVTAENYYQGIAPQVVELLCRTQESSMDKVVFRVACVIVGAMLDEHPEQTSRLVLKNVLQPLLCCMHQQDTASSDSDIVASEEEINNCIELVHKIVSSIDPSHPVIDTLVPVFPVIFEITVCTENTVSYLRQLCEQVLSIVYHGQPAASAVEMLHGCLFKGQSLGTFATLRDDVMFVLGNSGGVEAVRRQSPLSDDEWLTWSDQASLAAASVFEHGNLQESCATFFMSLLKKLTAAVESLVSPESYDPVSSPTLQSELNSHGLKTNLFLLNLLENFAGLTSESLSKNTRSLLEFVVETLSRLTKLSKSSEADSLALQSTLFCLSLMSLLMSTEDLAATTNRELWQRGYQCLTTLEANHSSPGIRNMAHQLQLLVASQGAATSSQVPSSASSGGVRVTSDLQTKAKRQKKLAAIAAGYSIVPAKDGTEMAAMEPLQPRQGDKSVQATVSAAPKQPSVPGESKFEQLWCELHDVMAPIRGHAFIQLRRLLQEGDAEMWRHRDQLLESCHSGIQDEDSYVYLSAIQALAVLVERDLNCRLPWLAEQLALERLSVEARLNLGEVLLRVTKNFGELAPKYRDLLVNSFLAAAKHSDPVVRSSAVSNLGELCGKLGYSFGPIVQEILSCLRGLIRDPADIVGRAAVLALGCIIKGMGRQIFQVMPHEVKDIYRDLKHLYATTSDGVTRVQAQVAIEELSSATQELLRSQPRMEKRIQILDLHNLGKS
ncbi:transport and Golgi organization protein 6 homolog [Haemaphysalis longicornis]